MDESFWFISSKLIHKFNCEENEYVEINAKRKMVKIVSFDMPCSNNILRKKWDDSINPNSVACHFKVDANKAATKI